MKKVFKFVIFISFIFIILGFTLNLDTEILPSTDEKFLNIFLYNIKVEFLTIIISSITFGIYSIIYLFQNFLTLGHILKVLIIKYGFIKGILFIFPHGIFEIPCILLTATLSLYIPIYTLKNIKLYKKNYVYYIKKFLIYIYFIIILTLISAFIETVFTTKLLKSIL